MCSSDLDDHIGQLSRTNQILVTGSGDEPAYYLQGVEGFSYAWNRATGKVIDYTTATHLYNAVIVTAAYGLLERNVDDENSPKGVLERAGDHMVPALNAAIIYGTLRRGSKGLAVSKSVEDTGNGLFTQVTEEHINSLGGGIVSKMLRAICIVQKDAAKVQELLESEF